MKTATHCPTCRRPIRRNSRQNALLWALYSRMSDRVWGGKHYTPEQFHLYYKMRFLGADDVRLPNGQVLTIPRSTADLSVDEFSEYFSAVEADAAERGVYLEDAPS